MIRCLAALLLTLTGIAAAVPPHAERAADHAVDRYADAQVELLAELVRFRTVHEPGTANAEHPEFRAFAAAVKRHADALGLDFTDLGAALVIGLGDGPERLGIATHGDVQPADPSKWRRSPFELDTDSEPGRLIARGAEDDKGPIASAMYAMKALRDLDVPLTHRIELIIALTEESDWTPFREVIARHPPPPVNISLDSTYPVVVAEKGWGALWLDFTAPGAAAEADAIRVLSFDGGAFISQVPEEATLVLEGADAALRARIERRIAAAQGEVRYRLESDGHRLRLHATGRAAHSSTPEAGLNALTHAAALLHGETLAPTAAAQAVRFVNALLGTGLYGERFGTIAYRHHFMGPLTVNLSTARTRQAGVELAVNLRAPAGKTAVQLDAELRAAVAGWAATEGDTQPSIRTDLSDPYYPERAPQVDRLVAVYRHYTGDSRSQPISIGGGTHARLLPNAVNFGPSMPGAAYTGHSEHEFITREQMHLNLRMYTAMLAWLASEPTTLTAP